MGLKYENFAVKFKGLNFEFKLLDDSAFFPNAEKTDKTLHEEFKIIVSNKENNIIFKFYNSSMEREISKYLNELGYLSYNNRQFKDFVSSRFHWGGYNKVKNRNDLIKERIINLFYRVVNSMAYDINEDLSSFSWWCSNLGFDEDSLRAKKFYEEAQTQQEKLLSLELDSETLKYLEEHAQQETNKFKEDIIKAVGEIN